MIPFASQRGGGQDLATHLLNEYDNELAALDQLRGAVASDLHGAFKEWEVQARTLTRCDKYLYSLSINPDPRQGGLTHDQFMDYIGRAEEALGLAGQPRAIVFHTKYGREHCHVVWSRIDAQQQRAVHLAFDHEKLMRVTRSFARDHGLKLPPGYEKSRQVGQESLYEREQQRQTGLTKADHMQQVTQAWQHSDDARSFVQALAARGYLLATGKRPYILVDLYGGVNALPKLIDDKAVKTEDIRKFLGKDFPTESLPTVEEAQELVARHRAAIERGLHEDRHADALAQLRHSQQARRTSIERERDRLATDHHHQRQAQQHDQRAQRDALRAAYLQSVREVRLARHRDRPTGLAAFLGRVTGIERLRQALHRRDDAKRLSAFGEQLKTLKNEQRHEAQALDIRLRLQAKEVARKEAALRRIDRRELAALLRDQRKVLRAQQRGGSEVMPSLAEIAPQALRREPAPPPDLLAAFGRAKSPAKADTPDVLTAFWRAAQPGAGRHKESGDRVPQMPASDGPQRDR